MFSDLIEMVNQPKDETDMHVLKQKGLQKTL